MTSPNRFETALATTSAVPEEISEEDIVGPAATEPTGDVAGPQPALTATRTAVEDAEDEAAVSDAAVTPDDGAITSSGDCMAAPIVAPATSIPTPAPTSTTTPVPTTPTPATPTPTTSTPPESSPAIPSAAASTPAAAVTAAAQPAAPVQSDRRTRHGPTVPLWIATAMCLAGVVTGFALARLGSNALAVASSSPAAEPRHQTDAPASEPVARVAPSPASVTPPAKVRPASRPPADKKRATVRNAKAPAVAERPGTGRLEVTAPEGAEVWLDGRRIGTGSTRTRIAEGEHRLEVRHHGARVGERFRVAPGETWTYAVTPR